MLITQILFRDSGAVIKLLSVFIWISKIIFKAFNFYFCLFTIALSLVAWHELQSLKRAFPEAGWNLWPGNLAAEINLFRAAPQTRPTGNQCSSGFCSGKLILPSPALVKA